MRRGGKEGAILSPPHRLGDPEAAQHLPEDLCPDDRLGPVPALLGRVALQPVAPHGKAVLVRKPVVTQGKGGALVLTPFGTKPESVLLPSSCAYVAKPRPWPRGSEACIIAAKKLSQSHWLCGQTDRRQGNALS
eukprot:SAG22_NODE_1468_length_4349_cov_2.069882_4_plen_134_part_00